MPHSPVPRRPRPAPWAVALFVLSSAFAAVSIALIAMDFSPA